MYIRQQLLQNIDQLDWQQKVLVIFGPRQIGKTTLLEHYLESRSNYLYLSGEDIDAQPFLTSHSLETLKSYISDHQLLVIDEAQKVPNIGQTLKLLIDHIKPLQIIATGSSGFDLACNVGEPLTGRKYTLNLFPLSQIELQAIENPIITKAKLPERLIYGSYPEVVLARDLQQKQRYLKELVNSYLYKDILELDGIRKSQKIGQLLQLIAYQIGKTVSIHELATQLGLNAATVERYLDLLEQCFVIVKIGPYSNNLRKVIRKGHRFYFYDNGVRNALVNQFNPIEQRNDIDQLWENYLVMERIKKQHYQELFTNNYFWRTYDQQEADWVEEKNGQLHGYEFKWQARNVRAPKAWQKDYPNAEYQVIHQDNYLEFIT